MKKTITTINLENTAMKRLLLILLCVPLIFSCGEKDVKKNKDKEDHSIEEKDLNEKITEETSEQQKERIKNELLLFYVDSDRYKDNPEFLELDIQSNIRSEAEDEEEDKFILEKINEGYSHEEAEFISEKINEGYSHEEAEGLLMSEYSDIDPNESEDYYDQSEGNVSSLAIGDMHQGGIIFWVDNTGQHGLVCDLQDLGEAEWGCSGTSISGANGKSIGTGQQNTSAILSLCPQSGIAAEMCTNSTAQGYSDWFLPSLDELTQIHLNIEAINATLVSNGRDDLRSRYWSSSQHNDPKYQNDYAWTQKLSRGGSQGFPNKNKSTKVRAVRAF